jgi:hypothetical protein
VTTIRIAFALSAILALSSCAEAIARMEAAQAARDDATCRSYELTPGDEKYPVCRMLLNQQRTENARNAAIVRALTPPPQVPFYPELCSCLT